MQMKHALVVSTQDSGDGKVSTNAWNDDHILTGTPGMLVGFNELGTGEEIDPATLASSGLQTVASRTDLADSLENPPPGSLRYFDGNPWEFGTTISSDLITADTEQGLYVAPTSGAAGAWERQYTGSAASIWFGVAMDGSTDDTTAANASFSVSPDTLISDGTLIASALTIPANRRVRTAGLSTKVKQKSGTAANTRIVSPTGSNVIVDSLAIEGQLNQAGDATGEQMHGAFAQANATNGDLSLVSLGSIAGTNIRGDPLYVGAQAGYTVSQVSVGHVYADNAYRNAVTIAGGVHGLNIASIVGGSAGLRALDIEPNTGDGDVKGVSVGYVEGRAIGAVASGQAIGGVYIGAAYLDPTAYGSGCTPTYASEDFTVGFKFRDAEMRFGKFKANGFSSSAIAPVSGGTATSRITISNAELTNCCSTNLTSGFIAGYGATVTTCAYNIPFLSATTSNASHRVLEGVNGSMVGRADVALLTASRYSSECQDVVTAALNVTKADAGVGGLVTSASTRSIFLGGTAVCDRFFSNSTRSVALGVDVTATSLANADVAGTNNTFICSRLNATFYHLYGIGGTLQLDGSGNFASPGYLRSTSDIRTSSATAGLGYSAGAGGTVAQATSKSTGVTLNKVSGQVTMNAAALASGAKVSFVVTDSAVAATDIVMVNVVSGGTANAYRAAVTAVAAGSFTVTVENITGGSLSEAPVIGFAVIKAVAA